MTRPTCAHCEREVPPPFGALVHPGHRICGGCRNIVCDPHPDCEEE